MILSSAPPLRERNSKAFGASLFSLSSEREWMRILMWNRRLMKVSFVQRSMPTTSSMSLGTSIWGGRSRLRKPCRLRSGLRRPGATLLLVVGRTLQSDLLYKNPKKECSANCDSHLSRTRLTIPREPMLETARRAKNFKAQRSNHSEGREGSTSTFKAHPLNRKILEGPSLPFPQKSTPKLPEFQEFKLKTSERAIQRSLAATTSAIVDNLLQFAGQAPKNQNVSLLVFHKKFYWRRQFCRNCLHCKKGRGGPMMAVDLEAAVR